MGKLRKVWAWVKKYWWIVVGIIGAILAAVFSSKIKSAYRDNRILQHERNIAQTQAEVNKLIGKKELLKKDYAKNEAEIRDIDTRIQELDKDHELRGPAKDRSMEENLDRFKDLGY